MNILLVAVNAKYIHSNLAVYSLKSYANCLEGEVEIAEYTINHQMEDVLADIYQRKPAVVAFSCYIWNLDYVKGLMRDLAKILPGTEIWAGGPEVSYDAESFLLQMPMVKGIMVGEGERTFRQLTEHYLTEGAEDKACLENCDGIVFRKKDGTLHWTNPQQPLSLDEVPFVYSDLTKFENRILYYESSRGCPFSCSYCLSSIDKRVRFRSPKLVCSELKFFLEHKVPQVKFVDRTFNCNHAHAMTIWNYIGTHDNGITNFHFEIAADLLNEEEIALIKTFRPGLIQLEIGVQSTNEQTLKEINRVTDFAKIADKVQQVAEGHNIHQHLDLIAGLPYEDYTRFIQSFNDVYALHPNQLQLGFLKVLKGSVMHECAEAYGVVYHSHPMYEVLSTNWISYAELRKLKAIEEMVEVYYNSGQFLKTLEVLESEFPHPFAMFEALAEYYRRNGLFERKHSRMSRLDILHEFLKEQGMSSRKYEDLLLTDLYLRENSKSRPTWAPRISDEAKKGIQRFFQQAAKENRFEGYESYSFKQQMHMIHAEVLQESGDWLFFDYQNRDVLSYDAAVVRITEEEQGAYLHEGEE